MTIDEFTRQALALRRKLAADPHRPRYHFLPPGNWINDPNGLIQWGGQYHLFYQHNPYLPIWGDIHWGHAVSDDLVRWTDLPLALTPTPGGPDADGCFSGCAVDDRGVPTLLYTGVVKNGDRYLQSQCLATSADGLQTWDKYAGNPVIATPPPGVAPEDFRDPWVWRDGQQWSMALGAGITGQGGAVLLYRSPDLIDWQYLGPLLTGDRAEMGEMWECPAFFPLGDRYVLLVSVWRDVGTYYFTGSYTDHTFTPECQGWLDHGMNYFFAPQTLLDDQSRRIMIGWIKEGRGDADLLVARWAGIQSVPRVLTLNDDGTLHHAPVPELATLRGAHHCCQEMVLPPETTHTLAGVQGEALDIVAAFEPGTAARFGLAVRCSPGGEEQTRILYDRDRASLIVERKQSSHNDQTERGTHVAPLALAPGERLTLRILLDGSALEVFANGGLCLSSRIYPTLPDSQGMQVFAEGGEATLRSLDVWEMGSIWE